MVCVGGGSPPPPRFSASSLPSPNLGSPAASNSSIMPLAIAKRWNREPPPPASHSAARAARSVALGARRGTRKSPPPLPVHWSPSLMTKTMLRGSGGGFEVMVGAVQSLRRRRAYPPPPLPPLPAPSGAGIGVKHDVEAGPYRRLHRLGVNRHRAWWPGSFGWGLPSVYPPVQHGRRPGRVGRHAQGHGVGTRILQHGDAEPHVRKSGLKLNCRQSSRRDVRRSSGGGRADGPTALAGAQKRRHRRPGGGARGCRRRDRVGGGHGEALGREWPTARG